MRSSTPRAAAAQKASITIDVFEIVAGTSSDSACSPSNLLARTANSLKGRSGPIGREVTGMSRRIVMLVAVLVLTAGCAMSTVAQQGTQQQSKTASDLAKEAAARPSL